MGVPKFYRWISERYPCLSEVVKEYQVPEFDNLYLDMNGIIHNCSHPNDDDPHFRITEEQIFQDIFHYIEVLFRVIRPRKTFFMAVDGVAPRAKMNQQRGRRFRSAKEAEENIKQALSKGEKLPTEKRFDSNCITPGTAFMERLQTQLEYFVKSKITYDQAWQGISVYLSGHQTPGEGEHKIMEFIRYERSQPDYDPNTRHCLYGLDADLIILALCTHEPHFALLREEVKFTKRKKSSKTAKAEETTFHLLHISLLREYIDHEFEALKVSLPFPYNLESIIDDWVLMGFLIGNDFIPHLPDLHIASNALPFLYGAYIKNLPHLGGYINEGGVIKLDRFQIYLKAISSYDIDHFEEIYSDYKWLASKSSSKKSSKPGKLAAAHDIRARPQTEEKSIQIVKDLAKKQGVVSDDSESIDDDEDGDDDNGKDDLFKQEFHLHKRAYYNEKFDLTANTAQIERIAYEYILGIQWICHYYYNGVQSWSWYYPYHYSPYMSDLCKVDSMKLKFKMNKPFLPFQQLLAVLPAASQDCIPEVYWKLMDENSEIGDFFPTKFSTDLNGKQQEWEAVVLIPFIDEKRLLDAMEPLQGKLSIRERGRNKHGPCQLYTHDVNTPHYLKSSLSGVFPDIERCTACLKTILANSWTKKDYGAYVKGLLPGCQLSVYHQGFPTLYHIPHRARLRKQGVRVFQAPSRNENMILSIVSCEEVDASDETNKSFQVVQRTNETLSDMGHRLLGKSIYVNWPHMEEAKVVSVSDGNVKYLLHEEVSGSQGSKRNLARKDLNRVETDEYYAHVQAAYESCLNRQGINIGETTTLLYAQVLLGRKYIYGKKGEITLEKQWSTFAQPFPIQVTVKNISVRGPTFEQINSLNELYPKDAEVFNLGIPHYGCLGKVIEARDGVTVVRLMIPEEPNLEQVVTRRNNRSMYHPGWRAATLTGLSSYMLSRMTGSIYIFFPPSKKWNVGLNLKFTKENCGIAGYTMRQERNWLYSNALCDIIKEYLKLFPEVFTYLGEVLQDRSEEQLNAAELFGSENVSEKLSVLSKWLKSLPCFGGRKVHESSSVLEAPAINAIDEAIATVKNKAHEKERNIVLTVKPSSLYRPMAQQGTLIPDKKANHQLLDRVVNVRMGYTVPLGFRGTIIGIHSKGGSEQEMLIDVVFDDEFLGGLTLGGQCADRRGYQLPACAVINLTFGDRLARRMSRPVAVVRPHHAEGSRSPMPPHNAGPGRFTQSPHSAFTPAKKFSSSNSQPTSSVPSPRHRQNQQSATPQTKKILARDSGKDNSYRRDSQTSNKSASPNVESSRTNKAQQVTLAKQSVKRDKQPSKSVLSLSDAAKALPNLSKKDPAKGKIPESNTSEMPQEQHRHQRPSSSHVHTVHVDKSQPSSRVKKLAPRLSGEEGKRATPVNNKTSWKIATKDSRPKKIESGTDLKKDDHHQGRRHDATSEATAASVAVTSFTPKAPDVCDKNAELSKALKDVLKLTPTNTSNYSSQNKAASTKPAPSGPELGTFLASLSPPQRYPPPHLFGPPPQPPFTQQGFLPQTQNTFSPHYPFFAAGQLNPAYPPPNYPTNVLLRPENFQPLKCDFKKGVKLDPSTGLQVSRPRSKNTSKKEGKDKLCEIMSLEGQADKSKDGSECATTCSTASADDVIDNDEETDEEEENDTEENDKSKELNEDSDNEDEDKETSPQEGVEERNETSSVDDLTKWCKRHNMYPPVYTYCNSGQGLVATVQLWNGMSFHSTPKPSRDEAMEMAALAALEHLGEGAVSPPTQPPGAPVYGVPGAHPMHGGVYMTSPSYYVKDLTSGGIYPYTPDSVGLYPYPYALPHQPPLQLSPPQVPPPQLPPAVSSSQPYLPVGALPSQLPSVSMGPDGAPLFPGIIPGRPPLLAYYNPRLPPPHGLTVDASAATSGHYQPMASATHNGEAEPPRSSSLQAASSPFIPSQAIKTLTSSRSGEVPVTTINVGTQRYVLSDKPVPSSTSQSASTNEEREESQKKGGKPKAKLAISFGASVK
ncbi:5'-3' exoribonuclease 1-like isoform X3 [Clavelina lepadiformis]|uniref:5'-3' exoribonuclease 1-like isoform X3 n=1 Tax=Clavelina lepadiformis TaxID=159417 RepID=UPI0040436A0B